MYHSDSTYALMCYNHKNLQIIFVFIITTLKYHLSEWTHGQTLGMPQENPVEEGEKGLWNPEGSRTLKENLQN